MVMKDRKKRITINEIAKCFCELEKEHKLLEKKVSGVYFWQIIRFRVYIQITQLHNLFGVVHSKKMDTKSILLNLPSLLFNFISYDLFVRIKKGRRPSLLLVSNGRKQFFNGLLEDVYMYPVQKQINHFDCYRLEHPFLLRHSNVRKKKEIFADGLILRKVLAFIFKRVKLSDAELEIITNIEDAISEKFGVHVDIQFFISKVLTAFYSDKKYYRKKIKQISPSAILLTTSYGERASLICAAKELGVPVIEVQHGTIYRSHMGYNHAYKSPVKDYCPDYFFSFGRYWHNEMLLPIDEEKIIEFGFPFFHYQKERFLKMKKKEKSILFVSQGTIGKELTQYAYGIAKELPNYNICFKLHPGEYQRWREEYPELLKAVTLSNVTVIESEMNIYELFALFEFQVGVYSTAIYEGLGFDCKTILVDLPGVEIMNGLREKGCVLFAESIEELKNHIEHFVIEQHVDGKLFFNKGKNAEKLILERI